MNLELLQLKKPIKPRGYQEIIISDILNNFKIGKPYVLGACPSSGKTEMAIEAMIRLMNSGQVNRVLILAHSTNVLKENFYERLEQYFHKDTIEIMRGQKDYNYDARIQVMIPQNINYVEGQFDLIVTDEAQHNVLAEDGNYSRIVDMVQPKFQLLLTGTPSKFILRNNYAERDGEELPYHINTVGMDMIGFDHFHDVRFDLIKSAYGFTNDDYGQTRELLTNIDFDFEQTERTVNNVIVGVVRNIALRNGITLPTDADFILEGRKLIQSGRFGKTLIMCRNIEQANQISEIISNLFHVKVAVSQSQNDTDSTNLDRFKKNKFEFLCVVNRAREGYDDNKVINLIDITMTHNIDLIYQMFCRVVRLDDTNPKPKLYIKVTSNAEGMPDYTMNIMTAALMLGATENLAIFNGNNFRGLVMPRIEREPTNEDEVTVDGFITPTDNEGNPIGRRRINDMMALDLIQMFIDDEEDLIHGNARYAMTTLGESLDVLNGVNDFYSDKEGYFRVIMEEEINSSIVWGERYKGLSERDGIRYRSQPWRFWFQTEKEFFDECNPNRNIIELTKEEYFNLIKRNNIPSYKKWLSEHKNISNKDGVKYHSNPWLLFNQSPKEFFDECYPSRNIIELTKEDYFKLIRENNVTGSHGYRNLYKVLSKRDGIRYHSQPWRFFKQTDKEFFDECYPDNVIAELTKEYYFNIIRKNNITSGNIWTGRFKELSEIDGIKYHSNPWRLFNQSPKEFFDECNPDRFIVELTKEDYFKLNKENNITSGKVWSDNYKKLSDRDGIRYHSVPWEKFNQSQKEFFDECYPDKKELYSDKEGYFKLFRREDIISSSWIKNYKKLSDKDDIKYRSIPWEYFNQSQKEFFDEYKEWLIDNPKSKRVYSEAFLGEFSEMNKLWNTTNSNKTHERLKADKTEWVKYHELYSNSRKNWGEIPYKEIANKLKDRPEWVVGDFGCGENLLSKEIKNKVHAFDHVAIDTDVTVCDLVNVPLHNNVLDVVVFSLSLMGTNYTEYFKEAYRVLKPMGLILIAEPCTRWEDKEDDLKHKLEGVGFKVSGDVKYSDRFIYVDAIKY